jgi:hypothetical protein
MKTQLQLVDELRPAGSHEEVVPAWVRPLALVDLMAARVPEVQISAADVRDATSEEDRQGGRVRLMIHGASSAAATIIGYEVSRAVAEYSTDIVRTTRLGSTLEVSIFLCF